MKNIFNQSYEWVYQSFSLFKVSTRFSLVAGMFYLMFYMFIPATPGLNILSPILIMLWPFITVFIVAFYLSILEKKVFDLKKVMDLIRGKFARFMSIGLLSIVYTVGLSAWVSSDVARIVEIPQGQGLGEIQFGDFSPIIIKALVITIPFLMLTWFAPLLIAFNNFDFLKSIKSSFAGCLLYLFQILIAWTIIITVFVCLIFLITLLISSMNFLGNNLISLFSSFFVLILATIFIAMSFTFQTITYRKIFKSVI